MNPGFAAAPREKSLLWRRRPATGCSAVSCPTRTLIADGTGFAAGQGVELVARTIQPWLIKTADRKLVETFGFVSTFSRTAEHNPQGI